LYPVNKSGIERLFVTFLAGGRLWFCANSKMQAQKSKKAGVKAGLLQPLIGGS